MGDFMIPNHVGIIMDGNGRWATKRGLSRSAGHLEGSKTSKKLIEYGFNKGIKVISIFAFSTENFKRSKEEVDYLMNLFVLMFKTNFNIFIENGIKIIFSGRKIGLPNKVVKSMESLESRTKDNNRGILNICLNYGGQDEIVDVVKSISSKVKSNEIDIESIDKELINKYLYNDLPPIDLLIRTSGEYRISNFMLWQIAYSELYFTDTLFPDFNELELDKALEEYSKRNRRFGS
jgi:undecaprenyl diphosphate synthase